jgi:hypothetical protein
MSSLAFHRQSNRLFSAQFAGCEGDKMQITFAWFKIGGGV